MSTVQITKVPLLDLTRQYQPLKQEIEGVMRRVCDSQQFILGPEVEAFERECAEYCRVETSLGVSSGTDALLLALMALGIGEGDEVITTPFSFFATAGSIARVGARPVFVDIDPISFNIDPKKIAEKTTPKTKAIMPVHLFGQCAEVEEIRAVCGAIPIIEDAAQAIGSEFEGKRAGGLGAIGCFSFFPSKNLGAFGEAGLVTANDPELAERMKVLRVHGSKQKYYHLWVGANFRIDALQAAILRVKLRSLDQWSIKRQQNAARYRELFDEHDLTNTLTLPQVVGNKRHIFNQYVVRAPKRDELIQHLKTKQVGCEVYYPLSLHEQECFAYLGYRHGDFPVSEEAASSVLALPIFPELSDDELRYVVSSISEFYHR